MTTKLNCRHVVWILGAYLVVAPSLLVSEATAAPAEKLGPSTAIVEPDMKEEILGFLREKERSGELAKLQRESADRAKRRVEEPPPVAGLRRTDTPRTFYFDPTFTQPTDIRDHLGRLVAAAGTRINPLEYVTLPTRLLFFDGRDDAQVRKAFSLIDAERDGIKAILVGGRPLDISRKRKTWMYFDQGGVLVNRFKIRQVPALVTQEGYRLRIEEIRAMP